MTNTSITIKSAGKLNITNTPIPEPDTEQLLVRVHYVALCGSDTKLYNGSYMAPHTYPIVIGHEWVGEIIKIGAGASKNWNVGDIVTGDCSIYCNSCKNCRRGFKNHCLFIEKRGITQNGTCSQYIAAHQRHLHKCPPLQQTKVLALAEPLAVSVEAVVNRIPANELKNIRNALIIGAGGIGALAVFLLRDMGTPHIVITDTLAEKLAIIDSFGFNNVKTAVTGLHDKAITETNGFDLIIEAAGSSSALQKAIELANPRGKIVCVGHQQTAELDFPLVMKKSLTIIASIGSSGGFTRAIRLVEKNATNIVKLITTTIPLRDAAQFFNRELDSACDVKVAIDMK